MSETSTSGGVGALTIGGVVTVVVIVGGVVLNQMGVFAPSTEPNDVPAVTETQDVATPDPASNDENSTETVIAETPIATETASAPASDAAADATAEEPATGETATGETVTGESAIEETQTSEPAPEDTAPTSAEPAPSDAGETDTDTAEASAAESAGDVVAQDAEPALQPATIDVIRFDRDGAGLIAGRATAGAQVNVLLDGSVIEDVVVPDSGDFVAFPVVEPAPEPRVVTIETLLGDEVAATEESFILAPVTPVAVAEAAPLAVPEAVETPVDAGETAAATVQAEVATAEATGDEETGVEETGVELTGEATVAAAETNPAEASTAEDAPVSDDLAAAAPSAPAEEAATTDQPATVAEPAPSADLAEAITGTVEGGEELAQAAESVAIDVATAVAELPVPTPDTSAGAKVDADPAQELALLQTETQPELAETAAPAEETSASDREDVQKPQSAAIAILRTGPEGVEVIQPVAPSSPELVDKVALDAISYTPTGDVVLTGRARPAALVRVYIDNSPVVDVRTNVGGRWRTQLDGVAPGIYTLRLDEIDPLEGKVLSRLETPFKREAPEVLAQPSLEGEGPDVDRKVRAVTVQKGDTLWAISQDRYGDGFLFVRVFEANKEAIRDPDLIYPGQIFALPE